MRVYQSLKIDVQMLIVLCHIRSSCALGSMVGAQSIGHLKGLQQASGFVSRP